MQKTKQKNVFKKKKKTSEGNIRLRIEKIRVTNGQFEGKIKVKIC